VCNSTGNGILGPHGHHLRSSVEFFCHTYRLRNLWRLALLQGPCRGFGDVLEVDGRASSGCICVMTRRAGEFKVSTRRVTAHADSERASVTALHRIVRLLESPELIGALFWFSKSLGAMKV